MTMRPSNRVRNLKTLELLDIRPDDHVLEVGFGPGLGIQLALQLAGRGRVIGIDHSAMMLREASRRNARALASGRAQLTLGSAEHLPQFAIRFDKVFAINVYMFWADPVGVLRALRGTMNVGSVIALTLQPRNLGASITDTREAANQMTASLLEAGFDDVHVEIVELRPVPAACVLGTVGQPTEHSSSLRSRTSD
jgi:SAM-dependent methyltransferase